MSSTVFSICSTETGRFSHAFFSPDSSFSRSNASRRPSFFTMSGVSSSTRSYVVKRRLHARHSRRRRITAPSCDSRESITLFSGSWQNGQRIQAAFFFGSRLLQPGRVERELDGEVVDLALHPGHLRLVAAGVERLADQPADLRHLPLLHPAGGDRRRAHPDAGGDHRLLRVEGDHVLVDGDARLPEQVLGDLPGELL